VNVNGNHEVGSKAKEETKKPWRGANGQSTKELSMKID
jgi:hypothetical protein